MVRRRGGRWKVAQARERQQPAARRACRRGREGAAGQRKASPGARWHVAAGTSSAACRRTRSRVVPRASAESRPPGVATAGTPGAWYAEPANRDSSRLLPLTHKTSPLPRATANQQHAIRYELHACLYRNRCYSPSEPSSFSFSRGVGMLRTWEAASV
jgi:hypothetical protein